MSDISQVLPIGKLPQTSQLKEAQVRRRRGPLSKEEEASLHNNQIQAVTFEEEMESKIDFSKKKKKKGMNF